MPGIFPGPVHAHGGTATVEAPPTEPPTEPSTASEYTDAGLPWFDYYGGDAEAVEGAKKFKALVSVAAMGEKKGEEALPENVSVDVERVIALRKVGAERVREMTV